MKSLLINFTAYYLIFFFIPLIFYFWKQGKKELSKKMVIAGFLSWLISKLFKTIFYLPRPFVVNQSSPALPFFDLIPHDSTVMSGHTAATFAPGIVVFLKNRKWGILMLIAALLVGFGRIVLGLHYPLDILQGALLGGIIGFLIGKFLPSFDN